jgi:sugar lactone lactonase YvrE
MAIEAPVNGVGTTIASPYITSTTQSTCVLTSNTGFPNSQYRVLLSDGTNYEIALVASLSGSTVTFGARAVEPYNGVQTAYTFGSGSTIKVMPTVGSIRSLILEEIFKTTRQPIAQPSGLLQVMPPSNSLSLPGTTWTKVTTQASSAPSCISVMRDGNLWFGDAHSGLGVGKVTPAGVVTNYAMTSAQITNLIAGSDGNMWASDGTTGAGVWKVTYAGVPTQYTIAGAVCHDICMGPDGFAYACDSTSGNGLWKITLSTGAATQINTGFTGAVLSQLCVGSDNNIWAVASGAPGGLYRYNPITGNVTYFGLSSTTLVNITTGPDGYLWANGNNVNTMYVIDPLTGVIIKTITLTASSTPNRATPGPDGRMWVAMYFASGGAGMIAIDVQTYAQTLYQNASIFDGVGICVGPDNQMWVTDYNFGTGTGAIYNTPFVEGGPMLATLFEPTGLTGATTVTRYVGGTTGGPPTTGTYALGDWVVDTSGNFWVCTTAGSPGTWAAITEVGIGTPATATQQAATMTASSANIVSGSLFRLATGEISTLTRFRFEIGIAKTAAGVATWKADVKFGTAGTTADATIATFTSGTNTAAADQATLVIVVNVLTTGATATANCLAFYQNQLTSVTGLGSLPGVPGTTATFNSTAAQPYLHVDITPGASAVMNAWCSAERLA